MKLELNWFFGNGRKFAMAACLILFGAGCVDINDAKVQVQAPGEVDPYGRNVLDKCAPHIYPHRLIVAHTGSSSPLAQVGAQLISTQQVFDQYWANVSVNPNDQVSDTPISAQPTVNWDQQLAYFYVVQVNTSCEKSKPMPDGMTTDCYSITIPIFRYLEGNNCQPPSDLLVLIYIISKVSLPFGVEWHYATPVPTSTPKPGPTLTPTPIPTATPLPETEGEDT